MTEMNAAGKLPGECTSWHLILWVINGPLSSSYYAYLSRKRPKLKIIFHINLFVVYYFIFFKREFQRFNYLAHSLKNYIITNKTCLPDLNTLPTGIGAGMNILNCILSVWPPKINADDCPTIAQTNNVPINMFSIY